MSGSCKTTERSRSPFVQIWSHSLKTVSYSPLGRSRESNDCMLDLIASLAFACIAALRGSSSVLIFVAFAIASDSVVLRFFSSTNIDSLVPFRAACSANHAVALRVALDILDAENGNAERDLATLWFTERARVDDERVVTEGGGGGGKEGMERAWEEEEVGVKERDEEWGEGREPAARDGNRGLLAGTCATVGPTHGSGGAGSGQ